MKKKILIGLCSFICVIGLAIGIGLSQAKTHEQVYAETTTFSMEEGASFRLMWTKEKCGITFKGQISTSLIDSGVKPQLFIVPQEYLDAIRSSATYAAAKPILDTGDYVGALLKAKLTFKVVTTPHLEKNGSTTYLLGGIKTIQNSNLNKPFFGIYFYEQNGVRTYASLPYEREDFISRSIVYLASGVYAINPSFAQNDETATEMTNLFMTEGIKESVKRTLWKQYGNSTKYAYFDVTPYYDLSTISYSDTKNTTVSSSSISSTVYDDYLSGFNLKVNTNGNEFNVGKYLDFYVDVASYDSNYFNKQCAYGIKYETIKAGTTNLSLALGKDSQTITANISPYDISNSVISTTASQINYIEQILTSGINLTEKYNSSSYTPTYTLFVNKTNKILANKQIVLNNSSGTWSYNNLPTAGDANSVTAKLIGTGNLTGTQNSSSFKVKQNVYTFKIDYTYGADGVDANNVSKAGATAANTVTVSGVYNTAYSYSSPSITGHTPDKGAVSGKIQVGPSDVKVTYNVNYYNVTLNCAGKTITHRVAYASPYKVYTPAIASYYTDTPFVSGTMGTSDITQTVNYTAVDNTGIASIESIAEPTINVHYFRDEHNNTNVAPGDDYYEGKEVTETEKSANYNVVYNESATDLNGCVRATNVYYETYIKTNTTTYNGETLSKLGIQFFATNQPDYQIMFYLVISDGSTTVAGTHNGTGLFKSSAFNGSGDQYLGIGGRRENPRDISKEYVKLAVNKTGANFTFFVDDMQVGTTQNIPELAGDCCFGLRGYNIGYTTTQSMYKLNASSTYNTSNLTNMVESLPKTYYYRDDQSTGNNATGDDYYEGTEITENECSAHHIMVNSSSVTQLTNGAWSQKAVSGSSIYYETYLQTNTTTYNGDLYSKIGITFYDTANTDKLVMFYIDVSVNSTSVSGTLKGSGFFKSYALCGQNAWYKGTNADYSTANRSSSTNFTTQYIKLAVSKVGSSFTFFVDDEKMGVTQVIPELAGDCYFGISSYNIGFTTKDSTYNVATSLSSKDKSALILGTISKDTFYYEARIKATERTNVNDNSTKVGITITNPANSWQYYFYMDTGAGANTHYVGAVDISLKGGIPKYYYWYRARAIMIPSINTWNTEHVLSVYKTGSTFVFMIDGMAVIELNDNDSFKGEGCQIGIKSFNVNATVSNIRTVANPTTLSGLCKERNILLDDITIDGNLSDWTAYEKATSYSATATDGSERGYKVYAKLGKGGVYVAIEVKSKNYTKQTLSSYSGTAVEQGDMLRAYWWRSFNAEFRVGSGNYSCNCPACVKEEMDGVSNANNRNGVLEAREVIRYVSLCEANRNVRDFEITSSLTNGYYNSVIEFVLPYESFNLDRTVQEVKMLVAVRTGIDANGADENVEGLGYWWTGNYHAQYNNFPYVVRDRIVWL